MAAFLEAQFTLPANFLSSSLLVRRKVAYDHGALCLMLQPCRHWVVGSLGSMGTGGSYLNLIFRHRKHPSILRVGRSLNFTIREASRLV